MFALADDEHGAAGAAHDLFGGAAHEDVGEAGAAVGREDDEVAGQFARGLEDLYDSWPLRRCGQVFEKPSPMPIELRRRG